MSDIDESLRRGLEQAAAGDTHDLGSFARYAGCLAEHPDTGNGCIEPADHQGLHRAMGTQRLQRFGPEAVTS